MEAKIPENKAQEANSDTREKIPPWRFSGYPLELEALRIPYKKEDDANPVFSGAILALGAWLCVFTPQKN